MSYSSSSRSEVYIGRDSNANYGPGAYTVNYDNRIVQQRRPIDWDIRGTEEEERQYGQYGEYKHGDIEIIGTIDRKRIHRTYYDRTIKRFVPFNCQQSIVLARIVSGERVGTIVTVEAYEGSDAPKVVCIASF
ncbi:hypothetical protein PM082_009268 [Marasmius tenuissimus]|nr:hypothetical protein PM082_009268 [Marasmius tenuissimus]